jgi:hypothetical protein
MFEGGGGWLMFSGREARASMMEGD